MSSLRRRPLLGMAILSLVSTAIGLVIVLVIDWFPVGASSASPQIDKLYDVLLIASVPIFVLVMAVVVYSVLAFRAQPGDLRDGSPIHGNTTLEIVWVTIPFIIVSALSGYGWVVLNDIEAKASNPLVVNVQGRQFAWSFDYPGKVKSEQLVLPKGRPVEFRIHTKDVIHDFWVPAFRLKSDAVPGLTTHLRTTPTRIGKYAVVCAELCGLGHSTMRQRVSVVEGAQFKRWLAQKKAAARDKSDAGRDSALAGPGVGYGETVDTAYKPGVSAGLVDTAVEPGVPAGLVDTADEPGVPAGLVDTADEPGVPAGLVNAGGLR